MKTYMKETIGLVTVSTCMALVWGRTSDGLSCGGSGNTGNAVLVGPLTTEVIANGNDLKNGMAYYVDEPLYVESRVTNGLYLCRCGEKATCINLLSGVCEDMDRRRRVAVASGRDCVDDDAIPGPLLVYEGVMNFQDRDGTRSVRLFRELSQEEQAVLIDAYRKMKQQKDEEAEAELTALREKAKKTFSDINVDPRGRIHIDKHFRDFVGLGVDKNTDKVIKAISDGDVETLMELRGGLYSKKGEKVHCVSENQIRCTEGWLKGLNRSVELEWLGKDESMPTYAIFRVSDELDSKTGMYERGGFRSSVLMDSEGGNAYVFCKGRRNPDQKYESEKYSRSRRIKNCKESLASAERDRIRSDEWIERLEKELLQIETSATQEVARLQMRLVANERDSESLKARIVSRKERQAEDVKRKKQQIAVAIKERDEKTRRVEEYEKIIAQIEKETAEVEAKRIEAERVPGTYTASWTNGFHKAQLAVTSSDGRIRGFRIEHNQKKITSEQLQEKIRNERRALDEVLLKIVEE